MPRSGTTVLQALLCRAADIHILGETHFFTQIYPNATSVQDSIDRLLTHPEFFALFSGPEAAKKWARSCEARARSVNEVFKLIVSEVQAQENQVLRGEKTPGHYEYLKEIFTAFPEAKILWMTRDPRSICASYKNVPWRESKDVVGPALRWLSARKTLKRYLASGSVLEINYEDLITKQITTLHKIGEYLQYPRLGEVALLEPEQLTYNMTGDWQRKHIQRASSKIDSSSLERWRQILREDEVETIEAICSEEMRLSRYELSNKISWGRRALILGKVIMANRTMLAAASLGKWKKL